jgi:hypothetical protein
MGKAQAKVPSYNWGNYDFGSGPRVSDRLNQGPYPQYPPDAVIPTDDVVMTTTASEDVVPVLPTIRECSRDDSDRNDASETNKTSSANSIMLNPLSGKLTVDWHLFSKSDCERPATQLDAEKCRRQCGS